MRAQFNSTAVALNEEQRLIPRAIKSASSRTSVDSFSSVPLASTDAAGGQGYSRHNPSSIISERCAAFHSYGGKKIQDSCSFTESNQFIDVIARISTRLQFHSRLLNAGNPAASTSMTNQPLLSSISLKLSLRKNTSELES
jgi:hypothetical protein